MRWLICGTVPDPERGLIRGRAEARFDAAGLRLVVAGPDGEAISLPVARGTPALAAAFAVLARPLGLDGPEVLLAGDTGKGEGSRLVYRALHDAMGHYAGWGITLHYLLPDLDWHNRLLAALEDVTPRPVLCADAGFMYAAKMSGYASLYDLFTPDAGELAFLADEKAPHPFYTRGFLLAEEDKAPELAARAHAHENAAKTMLVKGKTDLVVEEGRVVARIGSPLVPNLEPVGGTGDTVAGIVSALLAAGLPMREACRRGALTNRLMGQLARPTPATSVAELLGHLPRAWDLVQSHEGDGEPPCSQEG